MHAYLHAGDSAHAEAKRRVLILDDHSYFAACLRTLLDSEPDLVVCDVLSGSQDLRERIDRLQPHLLVIDIGLAGENGIDVAARLRSAGVSTPILFVSSLAAPAQATTISRAAFIAKSETPVAFLMALRAILMSLESSTEPAARVALTRSTAHA